MKELVFMNGNDVVTDSLMVAEVFGKEHARVMRDIRELICSDKFRVGNFAESSYINKQNKKVPRTLIKRDGLVFLIMGYTGKTAAEYKEKYIEAFNNMEEALKNNIQMASYMIEDPIARAERWIQEQKERKLLETQKLMLEQQVKEFEPKATYYDKILKSKGTITTTQIAKDYGLTSQRLNKILHEEGIQFKQSGQWLLYVQYQDKGYTKSHTYIDDFGEARMNTKWTQKGRLFIHSILHKRGIDAEMDKEIESNVKMST